MMDVLCMMIKRGEDDEKIACDEKKENLMKKKPQLHSRHSR